MSPIPPTGGAGGSGDPNDLWRLLERIPGATALVRAYWVAARAGKVEEAARILKQLQALLARYPSIAARFAGMLGNMNRFLRGLLAAADVSPGLAGNLLTLSEEATEIIAEGEEAAEALEALIAAGGTGAAESNPIGWIITAVVVVVLIIAMSGQGHAEEMPHPSNKPPKPGEKPLEKLPDNVRTSAVANPAKHLEQHARKGLEAFAHWRRKHCRCARRQQAFAPLGPNFAGQQLAMAGGPMFPGGGPAGPAGSAAKSGGSSSVPSGSGRNNPSPSGGGSPDPFSFPTPGGTKLPPPGKGPAKGPTLPDARIHSQCIWPRCLQFKGPGAAA
jgi:hypothetical protein